MEIHVTVNTHLYTEYPFVVDLGLSIVQSLSHNPSGRVSVRQYFKEMQ